jgi:hypothetical protein
MNRSTAKVIEFLNHPELGLGEEEVLFLDEPEALSEEVCSLLDDPPQFLTDAEAEALRAQLEDVEWSIVARELRNRIEAASKFFDGDAEKYREQMADDNK